MADRPKQTPPPIELREGEYFLIIVENGEVTHQTADVNLPHVDFVKRKVGELPDGAWGGSVIKIDGQISAVNSWTFCRNQLPAPEPIQQAVRAVFG